MGKFLDWIGWWARAGLVVGAVFLLVALLLLLVYVIAH